ncbi:MAG TPA: radical SAM protein [Sedimentisphaerales bacterium]|nr:radical SAM protein [Sedimentisphaerales bacterium]
MQNSQQESKIKPSIYNWRFAYSEQYDIWFNGFTEAAILTDRKTSANVQKVLNTEPLSESADPLVLQQSRLFTNLLCAAGFVVDSNFDESEALRVRHIAGRISKDSRIGLTIAPTMDCNLACPYCYAYKQADSHMNFRTRDGVIAFVEKLIQFNKAEFLSVSWVGGEPLVAFDVMKELIDAFLDICESNDCSYSHYLTTNGILLDQEIIRDLTEGPVPLSRIQITLDGPRDIHDAKRKFKTGEGTYDCIIKKLELLRGKCHVDVRINVDNKLTCDQAAEVINELHSRNMVGFFQEKRMGYYLAPIAASTAKCASQGPVCFNRAEFAEFAKAVYKKAGHGFMLAGFPQTKPLYCGMLSRNSYAIDSEGRLTKCWEAMGNPDRCIGHISEPVNLNSKVLREWLLHDPLTDNNRCIKCRYLPICMGGCPELVMTQGWSQEVCDHIKWDLEERLWNATKIYLTLTKHNLGDTQLLKELVREQLTQGVPVI